MLRPVVTVTVSPALNDWDGMKLAPWPSESATIRPVWAPLCDPATVIAPSWLAGTPRNVICVDGAASLPPGIGKTLTGADAWAMAAGARAAPAATRTTEVARRRRRRAARLGRCR